MREAVFSSTGFRIRAAQPTAVTTRVARWAEFAAASLFLTLFPADCHICGSPLLQPSRLPVCENCLHAPRPLTGSLCDICGESCAAGLQSFTALDCAPARCRLCRLAPPPFERAVANGSYDGALRDLIHLLKFEEVRPAAPVLGRMLADSISALQPFLPPGTIVVVPVPLHAQKIAQRGFNQAELIARSALKQLARRHSWVGTTDPLPLAARFDLCAHTLLRSRDTGSQIGLTSHQRRKNLRGAFSIKDPAPILGRDILLIDDVYTTGATASECARVLRRAGAVRVWVATVARTIKIYGLPGVQGALSQEQGQEEDREFARL